MDSEIKRVNDPKILKLREKLGTVS